MIKALDYLHSKDIVHGDIKADNILVFPNPGVFEHPFIFKLSDFGLSIPAGCEPNSIHTNGYMLYYRALEIIFKLGYSIPADIWALGCLIYYVYSLVTLFFIPSDEPLSEEVLVPILVQRIFNTLGDPRGEYPALDSYLKKTNYILNTVKVQRPYISVNSQEVESFITNMLQYNPNKRLSLGELLTDPFFVGLTVPGYLTSNGDQNLRCPDILDTRQKYQIISPYTTDDYYHNRILVSRRMMKILNDKLNEGYIITLWDYFPVMYLFDYTINVTIDNNLEKLREFMAACLEVWTCFKLSGSILRSRKSQMVSPPHQKYFERVNKNVEQILTIINYDLIVSTVAEYADKNERTLDILIKATENRLQDKYLASDLAKNVENL